MAVPFDFDDDAIERALEEQLRAKFGRDPGQTTRCSSTPTLTSHAR